MPAKRKAAIHNEYRKTSVEQCLKGKLWGGAVGWWREYGAEEIRERQNEKGNHD